MGLINKEEFIQILKIVSESTLDEVHLESGDLKLVLKRYAKMKSGCGMEPTPAAVAKAPVIEKKPEPAMDEKEVMPPLSKPAPKKDVDVPEEGHTVIRAPMLGTFYRAPNPDAPPFVEVGQLVSEEDVVCIIEVMKLFNTVKAGVRGRISKICAENTQMVEYKQVLFVIEEVPEDENREQTA
ncbi:MAG: acetyl-CoA carboxylase biotin carboxyl carrier protein [Desulfatiglandaceae bacterium]